MSSPDSPPVHRTHPATPSLAVPIRALWKNLVGVRYRSLAQIGDAWRTYSGRHPSSAQTWAHVARVVATPKKRVLCYPSRPAPWSVLYKLCALAGYWITTDPEKKSDAVFLWDDETRSDVGPFNHEEAAINGRCRDISKRHVSQVFEDIFGYRLRVDPTTYEGRVVKKSDENGTHDGEIVECPIPAEEVAPGYVYQKAIDNRREDDEGFFEYRVPVFMDVLPVVYVKYRPLDAPFKEFDGADVVSPESVLSEAEQSLLLTFAAAVGMEYGELDVLRDRADGRIYVVDANKTPSGPVRGFRVAQSVEALRALRPAFEALLAESARRLAQGTGAPPPSRVASPPSARPPSHVRELAEPAGGP